MALKGTLIWICSLAVLSFSAAQDETLPQICSSQTQLFERLSADLKVAAQCNKSLSSALDAQQSSELLLSMRSLTDCLHKHQLKECQGAKPNECPEAEVPTNGGLACVTVDDKRYCKPVCNHGYDFGFIRRSRLFDECSKQTKYKWDTQYVGGNKLAVCSASDQIAGAKSAYFPRDQDCLVTKSSSQLQNSTIEGFITELRNQGILGEPQYACLVCG
ncbi:uncharacterized protein si:ch1073-126c3.2 isoform X2 [Toxotes jaculatrix]|uniref:uncharacterized protein si:ch1073-126c3.2 isoform X2 n=1 Tax=Toxotes jaculatrix TaxID=941984 RepID=UPI001B3A7C40|nr:uncharacterized protein si:ch1073-126c3.2 isoform X2 [Toxotes jaculatrix]